ncbi:glycosyltransferase family 2 protein [Melittangium boletus]|uniref:glycosyltransferase family 2 protein n=1 Tax=Melittangium boletus TaxID=83453 RepID=UPI003DA22D52
MSGSGEHELSQLAEVRGLDVPSSHRARLGPFITLAKRGVGQALGPVAHALLAPQVRFNTALAALLSEPGQRWAGSGWARLTPLADPTDWRTSEAVLLHGLSPLLQAQHRWNLEVLRWLADAGTAWPPQEALGGERLRALEAGCDVLAAVEGPRWLRAFRPLWREVLRRQIAFNHACVRGLRRLMGESRPELRMPSAEAYEAWWREREPADIARAAAAVASLSRRAVISLVTPTYETPAKVLRACIESVRAQSYPHWELCLVDDGSRDPEVRRIAEAYARAEPRIRFEPLARNGGIAQASNAALALATGDYVGFLDHDDELAPHALAEVALHLEAHPDTDVLYSDEDKIDLEGRRFNPYFKPDFSPDLLRSVNYFCHFLVVRASLVREVGGVHTGFEGAQDHDLILRLVERTARVAHLPRVLYHWRAMPGSTSLDSSAKPAASDAGRRAVLEHLRRLGEPAHVETQAPGVYRVRPLLAEPPLVSILLLSEEADEETEAEARALLARTDWPLLEVVLCAGAVADGEPRLRRIAPAREPGLTVAANHLARAARGEVLVFLQPGYRPLDPRWLEELASQALRPDIGVVGARLVDGSGRLQGGGLWLGAGGQRVAPFAGLPDPSLTALGGSHWTRNVLAVDGACLTVRREVFERVGGFDERLPMAGADVAFCLRVTREGPRGLQTPHARLMWCGLPRVGGAGRSSSAVARDPFHNPNLSLDSAGGVALARTERSS